MIRSRGFLSIAAADFVVRAAYQMGKTPLLPLYAASLGAGDVLLGFIVSVSTLTGMVLKPFVGVLSDRWGRRAWLIVGTAFFAGVPFLYRFVGTPEQLFALRILHGLATAIYGPVTLAYVAGLSTSNRAERLGWFANARSAGYVVGPLAAGWMLLTMDPVAVFTAIGILSSLAFVPVLLLPEATTPASDRRQRLAQQAAQAIRSTTKTPAVWLAGAVDAAFYMALYAAKTFLPIHAVSAGVSVVVAGAFFSIQEAVHIAANPIGGRLGDRIGHLQTASVGMAMLGAALPLLPGAETPAALLAPAVLVGVGQALVLPSTVAMASDAVDGRHLGAGMGLVGSLKNAGKVAGPVTAGLLIHAVDFAVTFGLMGAAVLLGAFVLWARARRRTAVADGMAPG